MERKEIKKKLTEIFQLVVHNGVDVEKINDNSNIMLDLGVNSIGMIYLAVAIEKVFKISMANASINSFKTVSDVISFVEKEIDK